MEKYSIFCDLDGVLVDFDKGYEDLTGRNIRGTHVSDADFWEPIDRAGSEFWYNLEWMKDGKDLWNYIKKYEPTLLSAPSRQNSSRIGKYIWVDRELPGVHLILRSAKHKSDLSGPNNILIDDRADTIERWNEKHGIGILHINAETTIKELQKLGL